MCPLICFLTADDDETALPDDIAVCEEADEEEAGEGAGMMYADGVLNNTRGPHPSPAGHTQLSRVSSTAGGRRLSLTDEGHPTHLIYLGCRMDVLLCCAAYGRHVLGRCR